MSRKPGIQRPAPAHAAGQGTWLRHAVVALGAAAVGWMFYRSRMEWDPEMRTWRAVGDAALVLLLLATTAGPVARLWPKAKAVLLWRRALGVWACLAALLHAYLVWDGWARWSLRGLLGYEDLPGVPEPVLTQPGFGLANILGAAALAWMVVLLAVSSDRAIAWLGSSGWTRLQQGIRVVFHLVVLHAGYFLFLHYDLGLRMLAMGRGPPPPDWFRWPFAILVALALLLNAAAFAKTVRARRMGTVQ